MITTGQRLQGRYNILDRIGKGGFGVVYRAEDTLYERIVAIKVIRLVEADGHQVLSLLNEAKQLARNNHPNIVKVENFGETEDEAYMVMPLAEGGTLHDKMQKWQQLPLEVAGDFLKQIAGGLDYAHSKNILHRDLKPLNVLLFKPPKTEGPEILWEWSLQISDFGLAKALSDSSQYASTRINGTPTYMAPEQFDGLVGKRSDIYALGITLYQMLASEPPYKGTQFELMRAHFSKTLPLLSEKRSDVPPGLQELLEEATAKRPEDRLPNATILAERFQEILARRVSRGFETQAMDSMGFSTEAYTGDKLEFERTPISLASSWSGVEQEQLAALGNLVGLFNQQKRPRILPNILQFSPEGHYLAAAFSDTRLEVGAVRGRKALLPTVKLLGTPPIKGTGSTFSSRITALAFDPATARIISGEQNGQVQVWEVENGTARVLGQHSATVSGIVCGNDGTFVTASYDGTLQRWRNEANGSARKENQLLSRDAWVLGLVGLPRASGYWVAISWDDGMIQVCRADGTQNRKLVEDWSVGFMVASLDGRWLAAASEDGAVKVWYNQGEELDLLRQTLPALKLREGEVLTALSITPRGRFLVAGDSSGGLQLLDLTALETPWRRLTSVQANRPEPAAVRNLAWVDNQHLLVCYYDGILSLEDSEQVAVR